MSDELRLRVISGVILAVLVLSATWLGGIWFRCLAAGIVVLIHYEFSTMTRAAIRAPLANAIGWFGALATAACVLFGLPSMAMAAILVAAAGSTVSGWKTPAGLWPGIAVFYAGFSGLALAEIRGDGLIGLFAMLFLFAIVWATDILAYFCGRALGGPKLAPRISPGKTWSGALFGAAAGLGAGVGMALLVRDGGSWAIPVLALALSIVSQLGDLFESWVKRRFGAKDSSRLIPGHGGVMDRVDGLVFAAFAAFLIGGFLPLASTVSTGDELAARLLGL